MSELEIDTYLTAQQISDFFHAGWEINILCELTASYTLLQDDWGILNEFYNDVTWACTISAGVIRDEYYARLYVDKLLGRKGILNEKI